MGSLLVLLLLAGDVDAAEQALEAGKPAEAIRLLGDLARADDPPVRALVVLGRSYLRLGEYEGAIDPLLRASDALPEDRGVARDAALACWWSAKGAFASAYLEDAKRYAERAKDPLLVADLDFALGRFEEAIRAYRSLEVPESERLRVLKNVAEAWKQLDNADAAKAALADVLDEAIRREDVAEAFRAAFAGGRVGRLFDWLGERIAADPKLEYYWYRGHARHRFHQYERAAEDVREVLRLAPGHPGAKALLVSILVRLGSSEQRPEALAEAERLGREVLEADPAQSTVFENLGWLAFYAWQNRDVEHAYALLRFLHGIDPGHVWTATNYANMARRLGRYGEAEAVYHALLEDDPTDPQVLNDFGILQDGKGDVEAAVLLWKQALAEDPANRDSLENLFTKAWERGDTVHRDQYLERGLRMAEESGDAALLGRWRWFRDRLRWAPEGFGS